MQRYLALASVHHHTRCASPESSGLQHHHSMLQSRIIIYLPDSEFAHDASTTVLARSA